MKRFIKFGYTVNYVAFLQSIRDICEWCNDEKSVEKIIVADVEKLPRPEIGLVDMAETFGTGKTCHPSVNQKKRDVTFNELILRIKKHIFDNRIKSSDFFKCFDPRRTGFITKSQFHRGLDAIGHSGYHRLYIAPHDLEKIFNAYKDNWDDLMPDRMKWSQFCDDIDEVFTIK